MKPLIYLASPYSHSDEAVKERRFQDVIAVAAKLMNEGHLIFSPIAHSHPIAVRHALPGDWQFWQALDEVIVTKCDELWVLMLDGWEDSTGVNAEFELARQQGKRIRYVEADGELV